MLFSILVPLDVEKVTGYRPSSLESSYSTLAMEMNSSASGSHAWALERAIISLSCQLFYIIDIHIKIVGTDHLLAILTF